MIGVGNLWYWFVWVVIKSGIWEVGGDGGGGGW